MRGGVRQFRCAICKRSTNLQWQKDNPEAVNRANRKSARAHPEKAKERKDKFLAANPHKPVEWSAAHRRRNGIPEWGSPEHWAKVFGPVGHRKQRPSKLELSCIPMFAERGYRHTGDGSFWIRGKDGKAKNPDFKKTGSRAVIEVWGNYWHRGQSPQELIDWYADNGYDCEVYWESELQVATNG